MPWSRGPVDERIEFMKILESGRYSIQELSRLKGVSRQTAHKWIKRWKQDGVDGLKERSRRPLHSPTKTPPEVIEILLRLKKENPSFGPVTLVDMMVDREGNRPLAYSTAGDILHRYGLVRRSTNRRRFVTSAGERPLDVPAAGHTMTADHKGQFRLGDGKLCYPLTIADPWSRYLFAAEPLESTSIAEARRVFERVFRDFGVPEQIVTDNGSPFCNRRAVGGLTALSKWWIDLGSTPVRIDPGKPQQNGRHERMHRTLKAMALPVKLANRAEARKTLDRFRYEYNVLRPHRSLERKPPATAHVRYARSYPQRIEPAEYSDLVEVRHVRSNGEIKWGGDRLFLSEVLIGENVAFDQVTEDEWDIWYRHVIVATFDARRKKILSARDRKHAKKIHDEK